MTDSDSQPEPTDDLPRSAFTAGPNATYTFRLRGPWQYRAMAQTVLLTDGSTEIVYETLLPPGGRVEMPTDWGSTLGEDFRGQVLYRRNFGCPTGLDPADRIVLVIDRVDAFGTVALNGLPIGIVPAGGQPARFDITSDLKPRNQVAILVELPQITASSHPLDRAGRDGLPGGLVGEVRLQIEA